MTGVQLVVFPLLLLMLPTVGALAWWLKRRYVAAIIRLQNEAVSPGTARADSAITPEPATNVPPQTLPELPLRILPAREVPSRSNGIDDTSAARRLRRRVLSVHFSSGLLYWCAVWLFASWALASGYGGLSLGVVTFIGPAPLLALLVPAIVALVLQAGVNRRLMNVAAALLFVSGLGLLLSEGGWQSAAGFSFGYASIALLVSAFLRPSIRGAGLPLITAGIVGWLVLTGMFALALALDGSSDSADTSPIEVAVGVTALVLMLAAAVWCGWRTLMQLAVKYQAKRFSDMQLALGTYWALLTAFMLGSVLRDPVLFLFARTTPELVCVFSIVLWLVWRGVQAVVLRRAVRAAAPSIGALLFLRVFKPSKRSEAFTDRFFAYWRFAAPVWMIAGPDLSGAYLEPNEFFAYLRGRLREHFIADAGQAASRVRELDNARDPDGRFRVNELLCANVVEGRCGRLRFELGGGVVDVEGIVGMGGHRDAGEVRAAHLKQRVVPLSERHVGGPFVHRPDTAWYEELVNVRCEGFEGRPREVGGGQRAMRVHRKPAIGQTTVVGEHDDQPPRRGNRSVLALGDALCHRTQEGCGDHSAAQATQKEPPVMLGDHCQELPRNSLNSPGLLIAGGLSPPLAKSRVSSYIPK